MMKKSVLLFGATGLVGSRCLRLLVDDGRYDRIIVLTRSPLPAMQESLKIEHHTIDFERLNANQALMKADHVICALGSTMKKAGSKERFYQVDFTYSYGIAKIAFDQGAEHFLLVSALGANPESAIFYNRVKGELEKAVQQVAYRSISIFRPSLILGDRREFRFNEALSKVASRLFTFMMPDRIKPIHAEIIAKAMIKVSSENRPGMRIIESEEIKRIAAP